MSKILFWSGFGLAVRFWQLGIEMRPFFNKESLWAYPLFAAAGGSFGYWLNGVTVRQDNLLAERRRTLLEKRKRRAEREGTSLEQRVAEGGVHEGSVGTGGSGGADQI
ncbi:hypothetical protein OEA41_010143 [Lepraria neglecta]|uniref:Uncharacterized protein n=1 Tax=Lepraria neglecta TaxID=209136 RepID=A0AAD9Z075_9LECA|nr:hypothetical protein OEA41_010143 [Lepraria neglecta]